MASEVPPLPPTVAVLTITLDRATGRLGLEGPLDDRVLAYGMLGAAYEALLKRGLGAKMEERQIVVPKPFLGRG